MHIERFEIIATGERAASANARLAQRLEQAGWCGIQPETLEQAEIIWLGWVSDELSENISDILSETPAELGLRLLKCVYEGPGWSVRHCPDAAGRLNTNVISIAPRPGHVDTAAETLLEAGALLLEPGRRPIAAARGRRVVPGTMFDPQTSERIARTVLANPVIETWAIGRPVTAPIGACADLAQSARTVSLDGLDAAGLQAIAAARRLALTPGEMSAIQTFAAELGRPLFEAELETIAQSWSEHCAHRTFRARIHHTDVDAEGRETTRLIDGLFDGLIRTSTTRIAAPWVCSAFDDHAGVMALDERFEVAVKVETHNRPSALDPFGGAHTGVGGVIRDILAVSARPFALVDVLCFGPENLADSALPDGVLHPRRVRDGVIEGVGHYGNTMGIPTIAGAVVEHPAYTTNPLVFVGCLGIVARGAHPREVRAGDRVVVLGGRTGRDGLKGATFSSDGLSGASASNSAGAVQVGHPVMERRVLACVLEARDRGLYRALSDCGAGGLASAIGELARVGGAEVELARVPLKDAGLEPWEIWLSESQERMVLAVPPEHLPALMAVATKHGAPCADLGDFRDDGVLRVRHCSLDVIVLPVAFLHRGQPRAELVSRWEAPAVAVPQRAGTASPDAGERLMAFFASHAGQSRREVVRRYDTLVQGGTRLPPLQGFDAVGPGDGAVVQPLELQVDDGKAPMVVVGVGMCPKWTAIDPAMMARRAVCEALANAVAAGADPAWTALLDNFAWGDPARPDELGSLVRAVEGCCEAAEMLGTPFISGKDSLRNHWIGPDGTRRVVPGTLVVTAVGRCPPGVVPVGTGWREAGEIVWIVGRETMPDGRALFEALHRAIAAGLVSACHDVSEGGLAATLAEMGFARGLGAEIDLADWTGAEAGSEALHDETPGRFVCTCKEEDATTMAGHFDGVSLTRVGRVTARERLVVRWGGTVVMDLSISAARAAHLGDVDVA